MSGSMLGLGILGMVVMLVALVALTNSGPRGGRPAPKSKLLSVARAILVVAALVWTLFLWNTG